MQHQTTMIEGRAAEMETDFLARVAQVRDDLHIRSAKGGTVRPGSRGGD
ncbi:MAG TPA: hypothetical protein VN203_14155 [Candidatus Acidoferrum sp.]|nr:hypothetical protein [Candidatus Acidoferrum sp.]